MKTKEEIVKEFHNFFKDSPLFKCWNDCEQDIVYWWIKQYAQQNAQRKQELLKALIFGYRDTEEMMSGMENENWLDLHDEYRDDINNSFTKYINDIIKRKLNNLKI